jgi:acetyl-CoA carboxylase biotin carboxylase subunit
MVAKLICQESDRAEAIARMQNALEMFVLEGVTTTIPLLARLMQDPHFQLATFTPSSWRRKARGC